MTQSHALALTLGIEALVGAGLLWIWGWRDRRRFPGLLALVVASSALTHPLAWQANESWLRGLPFEIRAAIIELSVVAVEAIILRYGSAWIRDGQLRWWHAIVLSAACNATSFGYGLVRAYL